MCVNLITWAKWIKFPILTLLFTYSAPLDLVYLDLWVPTPFPLHSSNRYYNSFVNTFSRYTYIFLLTSKGQAVQALIQYQNFIEL